MTDSMSRPRLNSIMGQRDDARGNVVSLPAFYSPSDSMRRRPRPERSLIAVEPHGFTAVVRLVSSAKPAEPTPP